MADIITVTREANVAGGLRLILDSPIVTRGKAVVSRSLKAYGTEQIAERAVDIQADDTLTEEERILKHLQNAAPLLIRSNQYAPYSLPATDLPASSGPGGVVGAPAGDAPRPLPPLFKVFVDP